MTRKKNHTRVALADSNVSAPINSAFACLASKLPQVVHQAEAFAALASSKVTPEKTPDACLDAALSRLRRVHAFRTKKGRGGKTVTEIDHLESLDPILLALLCKRLCKRFGCGGSVESTSVILQGDQTAKVDAFFAAARSKKNVGG